MTKAHREAKAQRQFVRHEEAAMIGNTSRLDEIDLVLDMISDALFTLDCAPGANSSQPG